MSEIFKLLRFRHWIKNLFVFAPLVFAGLVQVNEALLSALTIFVFFSAASSTVYIHNDLKDLHHDRLHPRKSIQRPLASGRISAVAAKLILTLLLVVSLSSLVWKPEVGLVILLYLLINFLYSNWIKHLPVIEIFAVASGFPLRVYAGALAVGVPLSQWMFVTVFALALFLSSAKRLTELQFQASQGARPVLSHYKANVLNQFVLISAMAALVFYCMFVLTERPELATTVPLVLFGFFRYLMVCNEESAGESPTEIFLMDKQILLTVAIWGALVIILVGHQA